MKKSFPSPGWKYLDSLRDGSDEPIHTYKDMSMRWFVRQIIKGGRCSAFNQCCKSTIVDENFRATSEKLKVKRILCDVIETYVKCMTQEKNQ